MSIIDLDPGAIIVVTLLVVLYFLWRRGVGGPRPGSGNDDQEKP